MEDVVVFGGQKNMIDGFENVKVIYKLDMIVVLMICMVEVIGDDLNVFINNIKKVGNIFQEYLVLYVYILFFVGLYMIGWDNMEEGIFCYFMLNFMEGKKVGLNGRINIVLGFEIYFGNYCVIKCMFGEMDVDYIFLFDCSEVFDILVDGEFCMYLGGMMMDEVKEVLNVIMIVLL